MPALSLVEINNQNPELVYQLPILHNPNWWSEINIGNFVFLEKIKFDENIRQNMPANLRVMKGIYMFFLEPNHTFTPEIKHLMYIGRVLSGTTNFNFYKRFNDYKKAIGNVNVRRNIQLLTNLWPDHTYVYFYDCSGLPDLEIEKIENTLINKIIPPLNNQLSGRARQAQQLYN